MSFFLEILIFFFLQKQELLRMTEDVNILVASANNVKLNANYGNPQGRKESRECFI